MRIIDATSDKTTSQGVYRLGNEWRDFDENLARIQKSSRPSVSLPKRPDMPVPSGFTYIGNMDGSGLCTQAPPETLPVIPPETLPVVLTAIPGRILAREAIQRAINRARQLTGF
jgi:hypothetical protein